jgi:hypothetical protein
MPAPVAVPRQLKQVDVFAAIEKRVKSGESWKGGGT